MILIQITIISLLVFAIHYTMLPGEIFGFVDKWWEDRKNRLYAYADHIQNKMNEHSRIYNTVHQGMGQEASKTERKIKVMEKIEQPLFKCPVCMAGIYGAVIYWLIWGVWLQTACWQEWIICNIGAIGLNSIIVRAFKNDD